MQEVQGATAATMAKFQEMEKEQAKAVAAQAKAMAKMGADLMAAFRANSGASAPSGRSASAEPPRRRQRVTIVDDQVETVEAEATLVEEGEAIRAAEALHESPPDTVPARRRRSGGLARASPRAPRESAIARRAREAEEADGGESP